MAKDTDKLIRQLSLISFLVAERRPVSALEIKRDVEGYSNMNDDAFARRFYADRTELEALGIKLKVEKPGEGHVESEVYSLPPDNFYLPPIEFADEELAALNTALALLDGKFAYAEPLRLALQQLTWGRPSPLSLQSRRSVGVAASASAGGRGLSQHLTRIETAIERRKTLRFKYHTMTRDAVETREVDPYHLIFEGGQFYLVGYSHERDAIRIFRLSRIQGRISYATKAERDFLQARTFDPREYAHRIDWQLGDTVGRASIWIDDRLAWLIERDFGRYGTITRSDAEAGGIVFETDYAGPRLLIAWVLGLQENARLVEPPELLDEIDRRVERMVELHGDAWEPAATVESDAAAAEPATEPEAEQAESTIRPERFARLVTLAGILINAGRRNSTIPVTELQERLKLDEEELRDDIGLLNLVNFGAGAYVLYAEIVDGEIEIDQEPYGDNFARPARLLPLEAKALVAAIDLLGDRLPEGSLAPARKKIVAALGMDPATEGLQISGPDRNDSELAQLANRAIVEHLELEIEYYKPSDDEFTTRHVEPYALINGKEGWYVATYDPTRNGVRHFRLDRIKQARLTDRRFVPRPEVDPIADLEGWPATGEVPASQTARVWISPVQARWAKEEKTVVAELEDGSIVVELPFAGTSWLVREVLKEAGDAAILEPADARLAMLEAARRLLGATHMQVA